MANTNIRQFGSAAKRGKDKGEDDQPLIVKIAGENVTFHSPGTGQLAYLAAILSGYDGTLAQLGGLINFVANLMDDEDGNWFKKSLLDSEIDFTGEDALELCQYLIEEWSEDRPTQQSSGSARPQRTTGRSSTVATQERPPARRRSTSPSPAS